MVGILCFFLSLSIMSDNKEFKTSYGKYHLSRLPARKNELLQAWDAADEYVLDTLAHEYKPDNNTSVLLCNDSFGALAVALHECQVETWSDSWLAHQATINNYRANGLDTHQLKLTDSLCLPREKPGMVIIRLPKSLAFLEYQLSCLQKILADETRVIVASMQKNMPASVWQLLEKYLGKTSTSLARKKARLIHVELYAKLPVIRFDPVTVYQLPGTQFEIANYPNVFSRERLDIGTRFFLEHLPVKPNARQIIDLGCGNGVLGLLAAEKMPEAAIFFVDESYMAVESARKNFLKAFAAKRVATFQVGNGLEDYAPGKTDLILCNPPFHQQQAVGDFIARRMFQQSSKVLKQDGELWIIGNRHLGYHKTLKLYFKRVELVASNKKFVILKAGKLA